jgi:hypothetical protein
MVDMKLHTLESGIDLGQGINVGPGKFSEKINVGH